MYPHRLEAPLFRNRTKAMAFWRFDAMTLLRISADQIAWKLVSWSSMHRNSLPALFYTLVYPPPIIIFVSLELGPWDGRPPFWTRTWGGGGGTSILSIRLLYLYLLNP